MEENEFYTVKELAALLKVTELTVYRLVRRGELAVHRVGRVMRFHRADVNAFLAKIREEEAADTAA